MPCNNEFRDLGNGVTEMSHKHKNGSVSVSLIDTACVEKVKALGTTWFFHRDRGYIISFRRKRVIQLHRYLLDILDKPELVADHLDRCTCNNRMSNLRAVSQRENSFNTIRKVMSKSGYCGVFEHAENNWIAKVNNRTLGHYATAEDAARAVNRELFAPGQSCDYRLNLVPDPFKEPVKLPKMSANAGRYNKEAKYYVYRYNAKWITARRYFQGKYKSLGYFKTEEEAWAFVEEDKKTFDPTAF